MLDDGDAPAVRFSYTAEDGEEGYPGRLDVAVDVTVTVDNTLIFAYQATSDQDTVVNLTNHTYFNLHGFQNGNIMDVELQVAADANHHHYLFHTVRSSEARNSQMTSGHIHLLPEVSLPPGSICISLHISLQFLSNWH